MPRFQYLLGDSPTEKARLQRQAKLWDPITAECLERAGLRPGQKVLELGPGRGSIHLELRKRVQGPVDAIERSPEFATGLRALCQSDGLGAGNIWNAEILETHLQRSSYDAIFARWVFLFLPNPVRHLRHLFRALKPSGRLIIQDYHRDTLGMVPRSPDWEAFLQADRDFFASEGGDANIGAKLPLLLPQAGFQVLSIEPHLKVARPGSPTWSWLTDYFLGVLDRYAEFPPFDSNAARRLRRHWQKAGRSKDSILFAPTVLDVIAQKPRSRRSSALKR